MSAPLRHDASLPGPGKAANADKKPRHLTVVREGYGRARTPAPARTRRDDLMWLPLVGPVGVLGLLGINSALGLFDTDPVSVVLLYAIVVALFVLAHAVTSRGDRHTRRWGR